MGTTILSFEDRVVIETLHHEKHSLQYIADYLGFSKTTIFNEVHRLAGEYHAVKAQTDHEVKLSHRGRKTILTTNLKRLIEEKIKIQKWSIDGASINYGQLLVEYLYQDWRYPIWPLNMILILRR